jgi:hypothetical protein
MHTYLLTYLHTHTYIYTVVAVQRESAVAPAADVLLTSGKKKNRTAENARRLEDMRKAEDFPEPIKKALGQSTRKHAEVSVASQQAELVAKEAKQEVRIFTSIHTYILTDGFIYVFTYVRIHKYIRLHIYTYIRTYSHIYSHTYTPTHSANEQGWETSAAISSSSKVKATQELELCTSEDLEKDFTRRDSMCTTSTWASKTSERDLFKTDNDSSSQASEVSDSAHDLTDSGNNDMDKNSDSELSPAPMTVSAPAAKSESVGE